MTDEVKRLIRNSRVHKSAIEGYKARIKKLEMDLRREKNDVKELLHERDLGARIIKDLRDKLAAGWGDK